MTSIMNNNINNMATDEMYCPILYQLMVDPVVDPEGNSYERKAITEWLRRNPVSPITRSPLQISQLAPNRALKSAIDKIRENLSKEELTRNTKLSERCSTEMISILQSSMDGVKSILYFNNNTSELHLKLIIPNSDTRAPIHVCLVVDVSGSMGTEATMKGSSGQVESHGFSLLDIVKQAAHTVRVTLTDIDTLSIVKYSNKAEMILPPTQMTSSGKNQADTSINSLKTEGQTNIWDGLNQALEICRLNKTDGRNDKIILLTDGQPNIVPPRGHVGMLNKYKDQYGELPASIDTFGFGYNLDSKDLNSISVNTNGNYGFIPDASMVGDLFSNAIANFMATAVPNAKISFEFDNGIEFDENPIMGNYLIEKTSWGAQIETGALYYGQDKDFILKLKNVNTINNSVRVTTRYNHFSEIKEDSCSNVINSNQVTELQKLRLEVVEAIYSAYDLMRYGDNLTAEAVIKSMVNKLSHSPLKSTPIIKDLLTDLREQVTIAVTDTDHFNKWGQHYLPSLARAHQQQICNNFRDPGVQNYGGSLFKKMRDHADTKFNELPAPTPTSTSYSSHYRGMSSAAPATLASYNSHSGSCFAKESLVKMHDGSYKLVDQVVKGDKVLSFKNGNIAIDQIQCVLQTNFENEETLLVKLANGWTGTPNHPIKYQDIWIHPKSLVDPKMKPCKSVFSFLLKNRGTIIINDLESATFANNLHDNDVIEHDYFGTEKVVSDLSGMPGWTTGLVQIEPNCIIRNKTTGYVEKMLPLVMHSKQCTI